MMIMMKNKLKDSSTKGQVAETDMHYCKKMLSNVHGPIMLLENMC